MQKVTLTLSRLAAMAATSTFCLLATSCGGDELDKAKKAQKDAEDKLKLATAGLKVYEEETLGSFVTKLNASKKLKKCVLTCGDDGTVTLTGAGAADVATTAKAEAEKVLIIDATGGKKVELGKSETKDNKKEEEKGK